MGRRGGPADWDEPRDRGQPTPVELPDLAVERAEIAHASDLSDAAVFAKDVAVLHDGDVAQRSAPKRRLRSGGRRDLREVADQQGAHDTDGRSSACVRAAASASS